MKIVLAIDSFKGSLTSEEAGKAAAERIKDIYPNCTTEVIPISDGGEGMLNIMLNTQKVRLQYIKVHNPCMDPITTFYGISLDGKTAFIESANASGLPLIKKSQQNPMKTTTYGTGELIRDALEKGCTQFIIGIGGSATNDAGTGLLQALGFRFLDSQGKELGLGGRILQHITSIDSTHIHPLLKNAHFTIACDVQNPFYGPNGAAQIYAKQKGADDAMIIELDKGMYAFAKVIKGKTGKDIHSVPGSGAAGGMGGGLIAFLNAQLKEGAELLLDAVHFEERITDANLIITGEGRIDKQSLMGKIPGKILQMGQNKNIPVIAIAGCISDYADLKNAGFAAIYTTKPASMPLEEAMRPSTAIHNIQKIIPMILSDFSFY